MSLSYCNPPATAGYSAAAECLTKPKGKLYSKNIYDGRSTILDMITSSYNTKNLSKNIGYNFNLGVSEKGKDKGTYTGIPGYTSGSTHHDYSFTDRLMSYVK